MAKKFYIGISDKAKQAADISIGVDGKAKKVSKIYIGDENGKAQLVYDNTPVKLIVRPYARYGRDYSGGTWNEDISSYGTMSYSSNQITQTSYALKQVVSYHRLLFQFADGREMDIAHFCHDNNKTVVLNVTNSVSYGGSGYGGWNTTIDDLQVSPTTWGTKTDECTIPKDHTKQSLVVKGTVYGSFLYMSAFVSSGSMYVYNYVTFNSCKVNGVSVPITVESAW